MEMNQSHVEMIVEMYGDAAVGSTHLVEDVRRGEIFLAFYHSEREAVDAASREWAHLSRFDKKDREMTVWSIEWRAHENYVNHVYQDVIWKADVAPEEEYDGAPLLVRTPSGALRQVDLRPYGYPQDISCMWQALALYDKDHGTNLFDLDPDDFPGFDADDEFVALRASDMEVE